MRLQKDCHKKKLVGEEFELAELETIVVAKSNSAAVDERARYSASVDDLDTVCCFFEATRDRIVTKKHNQTCCRTPIITVSNQHH